MKIIQFKEKHFDRMFIASTPEDIDKIFFKVFAGRNAKGCYSEDKDEIFNIACSNTHKKRLKAMHLFMENRQDYEYEGYEIIEPESID